MVLGRNLEGIKDEKREAILGRFDKVDIEA